MQVNVVIVYGFTCTTIINSFWFITKSLFMIQFHSDKYSRTQYLPFGFLCSLNYAIISICVFPTSIFAYVVSLLYYVSMGTQELDSTVIYRIIC